MPPLLDHSLLTVSMPPLLDHSLLTVSMFMPTLRSQCCKESFCCKLKKKPAERYFGVYLPILASIC